MGERKRRMQKTTQRPFHITIGTGPNAEASLANDIRLVKVALMYGDRVTLCSPQALMILGTYAIGELKGDNQIEFFEGIAPQLIHDPNKLSEVIEALRMLRQLSQKKRKTQQELMWLIKTRQFFAQQWKEVKQTTERIALNAGADGLAAALNSGLLDIQMLRFDGETEDLVRDFVKYVMGALANRATYPLFDSSTGGLVDAHVREGHVSLSEATVARGRHPSLASHLFQRLPSFEEASVAEVLDIRRDLSSPLIRFRAAVMQFSDAIRSAAWDKDFINDAEEIVHKEIAPAILDIEEAVKSNRYLSAFGHRIVEKPLSVPMGSVLGIGISKLAEFPELAGHALALGGGATTVAVTASEAYVEWKEKRQETERNQLYFYYEAGRRLA